MSPEITIGLAVLLALFVFALVAGMIILRRILKLDQDRKTPGTAQDMPIRDALTK
ncbi:hypothetical protein HFU84_08120 [Acidithiobacillus sp. CV18-2]|uniref:Uncharacterized protein n=1 Tax=Igneacidithiobacillus copahuensis TaxID=2724909 RepID=A0AAE3CKP1_9PROT|nr:hypothetical protein [Igneacidithiobacillus copahuensis]MBU2755040.1 hypothetical protein [Acidithiobacillus sp. CV18-3]MBU2758072.1 hypothetical protein [Acidithiobacillus sp. BN09-2]MBU2777470.1 hypothetical protein [Acidithiobacillus sp. CV18-2]MBU2796147.1 hypothetical protein [Acidithiobacillus sp. VAN18-2]MBU2800556.1 hypothetical protein [Acidithiobacillus sp. VAN18-4]UTV82124.1 hypothetical protein MQE22_05780 [Acidithiobacillus sp. YTS05]